MKLFIADSKRLTKYNLPNKIEEYFLIEYKGIDGDENHCITLGSDNGMWKIKSNGDIDIISNDIILPEVELKEYSFFKLKVSGSNESITIFSMPNQESKIYKLSYSNLETIKIGNSPKNNINYVCQLCGEVSATISKLNDSWNISKNESSPSEIFLNNRKVNNSKLKFGDIIFINGLKIIWMKDFIEINNPRQSVSVTGMSPFTTNEVNNNVTIANEEEDNNELYNDDEYFYHIPRIKQKIEVEEMEIDPPPGEEKKDDVPFVLTLGSTLTMGASSFITAYILYGNLSTGKKTVVDSIPQIVMLTAMIVGALIFPRLLKSYQNKKRVKREKERQEKYSIYLKEKNEKIEESLKKQKQIMLDNNDSIIQCADIINKKSQKIWSRELRDDDFLTVRLGLGNIQSSLKITAPVEHFTLDKDNLFEEVYKVVESSKLLKDVPITHSFISKPNTSMVFNCSYKEDYLNGIMTQLIALHSSNDLKIVILTDETGSEKWEYTKILPHCWSDDKSFRFFGTKSEEYNEISNYLNDELKTRKEKIKSSNSDEISKNDGYKNFYPYYLIIIDNYRKINGLQIINELLKTKDNFGFSILSIADSMKNLPNNCENFIQVSEKNSCILNKEISSESQQIFTNESVPGLDMESLSIKISNIPVMPKDGLNVLPTSLSFLEMLGVSRIEQLNILNRWQDNLSYLSLSSVIGVHTNGEQFKLDLHEKYHGPHGLIAGSTGSGKSEFIITYILSMATNYHPYEVQFVLIDYKGGGLAGAFENKETGNRIPHLIGTITNLDTSEMNRTLVSIESELKRRQVVFNEVRDTLGESTIDIYKYQKLYREGMVKEPMAHLFIISDEFAELKAQQPEFMNQLITTARIGRSLGIHLILATQKPSGVVNDQIWSNAKFKVCLKVQDRGDSMEMLKKPDAASLKDVGRFYLQVGYDDYFDIGQSGWGGAKYVPTNKIVKKVDDSISFVNNVGEVVKSINELVKKEVVEAGGDQLTNVVRYISELGVREKITTRKLWLDKIPEIIYIKELKEKYSYKASPYLINPIIGEYDKPSSQQQGLLNLDLTRKGNTLIYGQSGSGKENLVTTIIWSSIIDHTPEEINYYIIDCGAETLKIFNNIPHIGDISTVDDADKIIDIFKMVGDEIEKRKDMFADYSGSYVNYIENSGNKLPLIAVVINNYEMFSESFSKLAEGVQPIYRDCNKYGVVFIISSTSTTSIRSRMSQSFENKICLQLPNEGDYRTVLNSPKGLFPFKAFGRGIVSMDDTGYEFQTASICDSKELNNYIKSASLKMNDYYKVRAKKINTIPSEVKLSLIMDDVKDVTKIPLGFNLENKDLQTYNFTEDKINTILSNDMGEKIDFIYALIHEFEKVNANVTIIDLVSGIEKTFSNSKYYNSNFDEAFINISKELANEKNSDKKNIYFFIGIGEYKGYLSDMGKQIANNIFSNVSVLSNTNFIFVDNYSSYKKLTPETWFQTNINNSSGIWLGEGIGSQVAINISNINMDDRKLDFPYLGFTINRTKRSIIKCVIDDTDEGDGIIEK